MQERYYIDKVGVSVTNLKDSVEKIINHIESSCSTEYVCVTNVRATYIGNHDQEYCNILNNSLLTVPDGKPVEWYAHIAGYKVVKKTSGNDLFEAVCQLSQNKGYTHYFIGSTQEVINTMVHNVKIKYPKINIVNAVSPPFLPVDKLVTDELVKDINNKKPNFIWVGLGAPKQERFISLIKDKISSSLLIGIGLVFDYQAGTVSRAPKWMQNRGLEWVYIWIQQPQKIIRSIPYFLSYPKNIINLLFKKYFK